MTTTTQDALSALSDSDLALLRHEAEMVGNVRCVEDCYKIQAARYLAGSNQMIGHLDPRYFGVR